MTDRSLNELRRLRLKHDMPYLILGIVTFILFPLYLLWVLP